MWMINPKLLCKNHLLGEHVEIHKLIGCLKRGKSIKRYIEKKFLSPPDAYSRHDILVKEMKSRQYKHQSDLEKIKINYNKVDISIEDNLKDLCSRCPECKKRIEEKNA